MFAVITPALISGAYAERMKFSAYCAVHARLDDARLRPDRALGVGRRRLARKLGALDFAGGTVVHLSSGISALVVALVLGKRKGYPTARHPPHDLTMTVLGAGLLWFGWFGFNAGSALAANGLAALALVNTHVAAAAGAVAWGLVEGARIRKVTMLGVASGLVAGLVAITPAAGYVSPMVAIVIGAAAGGVCYGAVLAEVALRLRRRARRVRRARRRRRDRRAAHRRVRRQAGVWLSRGAGVKGGGGGRGVRPSRGLRAPRPRKETHREVLRERLRAEPGDRPLARLGGGRRLTGSRLQNFTSP